MNARETLEVLLSWPIEEAILICGDHGIGKSQMVKQAAKILGIPCIDFRLSQNDVGDLKGMPFHVKGRTVFAPPEFMPLREEDITKIKELLRITDEIKTMGDRGFLFLDEVNRANREVQQAAFELVLDRRLNLRALPDGWRVVAAINEDDDIYTVNAMEPAFLSRFFKIDFRPTHDEWMKWADDTGVHTAVTSFLRKYPEFLDPSKELLKEATAKGSRKVHDRRAWDKFSRTLLKLEEDHKNGQRKVAPLSKDSEALKFLLLTAEGFVGHIAALKFYSYIETDYQSLDADTILNKWDKDVASRVKAIIKKGSIPELASYTELLVNYVRKNVQGEFNEEQSKNFTSYIELMPNELIVDLWQKLSLPEDKGGCYTVSKAWYKQGKNSDIILKAMASPYRKKKGEDNSATA